MNREDIIKLADEARDSISSYCINDCKAKCCKFGQLLLQNENEIQVIVKNKKNYYLKKNILKQTRMGNYAFELERTSGCLNLDENNLCSIYKNPNKPRICSDFPLFLISDKFTLASDFCPAAKEGLLDSYCLKLEKLGLKKI